MRGALLAVLMAAALFSSMSSRTTGPIEIPPDVLAEAQRLESGGRLDYRFSSDGCSGGVSWVYRAWTGRPPRWEVCCVRHDLEYWRCGDAADRSRADAALGACVGGAWGEIMRLGVRVGGTPLLPDHYRWCYGKRYYTGYEPRRN
jgi:predicted small lipoprotein YifL